MESNRLGVSESATEKRQRQSPNQQQTEIVPSCLEFVQATGTPGPASTAAAGQRGPPGEGSGFGVKVLRGFWALGYRA